MNSSKSGLQVRGLGFAYPVRRGERQERGGAVLQSINLDVAPGEMVCLLGPSGAGKTTLLRCVAGLERAYSGTVTLDSVVLDALAPHERRVGMLFQEPALFPHLDVAGNVAFGMRYLSGLQAKDKATEVARLLKVVGLSGDEATAVDGLSGGQRQRVALARTLAAQPAAVMLDEPLAALDRPLRERIGPEIRALLHAAKVPALWVTHDEQIAALVADRVLDMQGDGQVHTRAGVGSRSV